MELGPQQQLRPQLRRDRFARHGQPQLRSRQPDPVPHRRPRLQGVDQQLRPAARVRDRTRRAAGGAVAGAGAPARVLPDLAWRLPVLCLRRPADPGRAQRRQALSYAAGSGAQPTYGYRPEEEVDSDRHSNAGYAGLSLYPAEALLVSLTGRYEHYSDFGGTWIGRLSTRYDFTPAFALRATVSNGFQAPSLGTQAYKKLNNWNTWVGHTLAVGSAQAVAWAPRRWTRRSRPTSASARWRRCPARSTWRWTCTRSTSATASRCPLRSATRSIRAAAHCSPRWVCRPMPAPTTSSTPPTRVRAASSWCWTRSTTWPATACSAGALPRTSTRPK